MTLRAEIRAGVGVLVALLLVVAFAAISLLGRMSPAIETILRENVVSLEAAEEMLAVMAAPGERASEGARRRYEGALGRAEQKVTREDERPVLAELRRLSAAALRGEVAVVSRTVALLRRLAEINREEMRRRDLEAQRLGVAGAWAVVLLGLLGLLLATFFVRRLVRRLLRPLAELQQTLAAAAGGDARRRALVERAPLELLQMAAALNALLDRGLASGGDSRSPRGAPRG